MRPNESRCDACGAKTVEYPHVFNTGLATGLARLYEAEKPVNKNTLGLTHNQMCNFPKLQYWGLIEKYTRPDGTRAAGQWKITDLGIAFVEGQARIQDTAWTYRNHIRRHTGKEIPFPSRDVHYKQREYYAENARPVNVNKQLNLI